MKKLFLLVAFTGIVGASFTTALAAVVKHPTVCINGDEKKEKGKKDKSCTKADGSKKCCKMSAKSCTKGEAAGTNEKGKSENTNTSKVEEKK